MLHTLLKTLKSQTPAMNKRLPYEDFACPKCGAPYRLVRVPAAADSRDPPLHCKACNQELASTDGENILKYFLVGRRRRSQATTLTTTR
jgi:transcription elongation factor Elf1